MPSLSPLSEGTESLAALTEGTETLTVSSEGNESLTTLAELVYENTTRLGFFPDTTLVEAPYPYPSSTSYPGDTTGSTVGLLLSTLAEGAETLTPLSED